MSADTRVSFGQLLRRYRRAAGLTQEALAERALLSAFTISALERGTNQSPRKDTLALLAEALALAPLERTALEAAARGLGAERWDAAPPVPARTAGSLVGRAHELAMLERHLAGVGPPVLLLAGEPGIGKSRLLREAHTRARAGGWTVLAGGCRRGGGQDPYAPLPAALEQGLRRAAPNQARAALEGCAWLARLLPETAALGAKPLPAWTLTPAQERRLVVRALERYLRNVAGPAGTLLLLDDLQWAGVDGLEVLAALLESTEEIPLRVVAAYRGSEAPVGEALGALVADLLSKGRATRRTLEPLLPEEARVLLDALLADRPILDEDRAEVLRRAEGIPYFLVSCAEGLAAGGPGMRVPESVTQSIRQRVATLSPAAQEVLRAAAVIGRLAERALLPAMAVQPRAEVLEGLEAACRAHLLEEEGSTAYRFAHDLVRDVVEGDLSAARRAALHQRVAETLESGAGVPDVEAMAYHYCRSDAAAKAVEYLEKAGDHARATGANAAAEGYYRNLLQRLEARGGSRAIARIRAKLGLLFAHMENAEQSFAFLRGAAAVFDWTRRAGDAGSDTSCTGDERDDDRDTREVYLACATLALAEDRYRDCKALAQRAADLARDAGDSAMHADALRLRAVVDLKMGLLPTAMSALKEARALSERAGALVVLDAVLNEMYFVYELSGDFAQAARHIAYLMENAERIGDPAFIGRAILLRGWLAILTGEWERARADSALAARIVPYLADDLYVVGNLAYVSLLQGAWAEAGEALAQTASRAERRGDINCLIMIERWRAELDILQEQPAAALARLRAALAREQVHDTVFMLPLVAWAHLRLGELEHADRISVEAIARARAEHTFLELPNALRIRALVATALRRWEEAAQSLDEGLALARRMPYPYAEARLLQTNGELRAARGESPAEHLKAALAIFARLGARKDVEQVTQQLVGIDPIPVEVRPVERLTPEQRAAGWQTQFEVERALEERVARDLAKGRFTQAEVTQAEQDIDREAEWL